MSEFPARLTEGHILRHMPPGGNIDKGTALLDIAQDFLLASLAAEGFFQLATFKGGTAIRKFVAGARGRFSTDIDMAVNDFAVDRRALADLLVETVEGREIGPFRFNGERRDADDRWKIRVETQLGSIPQTIKVDVGPSTWLSPDLLAPVEAVIHNRYQFDLPRIPVMKLEETLSEKIARLHRLSTARDAYDLVWCITTSPHSGFDRGLVRRLSVLKIWGDVQGLAGARSAAPRSGFNPADWLRNRDDWDDESIGLLAAPPPSLSELGAKLRTLYSWLGDLTEGEQRWARCDARDRASVVAAVATLDGSRFSEEQLWAG